MRNFWAEASRPTSSKIREAHIRWKQAISENDVLLRSGETGRAGLRWQNDLFSGLPMQDFGIASVGGRCL